MKRFCLALTFTVVALAGTAVPQTVSAQEILLEGPLAGAPAVRKLVQYREMRFSAGPQLGYTLNNEYMHNILLGVRLEFNIFEWLGIGAVGYYAFNVSTTLTDHITASENIGGQETTPTESNWPSYTGASNFEDQVAKLKGMYLAQIALVPFRGKMSIFEKLFVAIDGSIFLGGGVVQYEQRKKCGGEECGAFDDPGSWAPETEMKIRGTFTWGIGFMAHFNEFFAVNLEYRMTPFKWNAGGTDEAGQAGAQWELNDDEAGDPYWEVQNRGSEGDYPDGNIDDQDLTWNVNMNIALGFIFYFPFEPTIAD